MNPANKKTWCINAYHSLSASNDGTTRPCCMYVPQDYDGKYVLGEKTIDEHLNHPEIQKLRSDCENDIRNPGCIRCWKEEDGGGESKRIRDNKKFDNQKGLVYFEASLGNQCNLRCRTCSPHSSSQWIDEGFTTYYNKIFSIKDYNNHIKKFYKSFEDDSSFWPDLESHLDTIKHLEFYGGEPFMSKKMWRILELAVEKGYAKDMEVHYATNGTLWPSQTELWQHFKRVSVHFSIDGSGKQFEFMRYLADWETVKTNMAKSRTTKGNLTLGWFVTLSNLNVYYLPEIIEEFRKNYSDFGCFLNLVHAPKHFNISIMPDEVKQQVLKKLRTIPEPANSKNDPIWRQLPGIIGFIENGTLDPELWSTFIKEITVHDDYRKQDYREVFPEFASIIGLKHD
jgi:MoaA/NifB/PqqE/SkfB family radical SAM enzyme